jgi:hypothetical protein
VALILPDWHKFLLCGSLGCKHVNNPRFRINLPPKGIWRRGSCNRARRQLWKVSGCLVSSRLKE